MSDTEFRQAVWQSCTSRVIAMIEEYSAGWSNGPSKEAATAIMRQIRNMPVPRPRAEGDPRCA